MGKRRSPAKHDGQRPQKDQGEIYLEICLVILKEMFLKILLEIFFKIFFKILEILEIFCRSFEIL